MSARSKNVLGLLLTVLCAALVAWLTRRTQRDHLRALDAVPADAFLVIDVDADLLRKSPVAEPVLGGAGDTLLGNKTLRATCGFDPMDRMREIAVAVPMEDDTGEFGVAVRADVTKDELVECTRKILDARGVSDAVSFRQSGSFTWIEPSGPSMSQGAGRDLAKRYPTLAYREGGPYLIARGAWLAAMVDTAEGKRPSARHESPHAALRRALGQASDEAPSFALVATVVLPKEMRQRLKKDMEKEIADQPGKADRATLMDGVLGVEAAGLGVSAGDRSGGESRLLLDLRCEDEAARRTVARIIDETRRGWVTDGVARLWGIEVLLENLTLEERGDTLRVSTRAPAEEVAAWVERALGGHRAGP